MKNKKTFYQKIDLLWKNFFEISDFLKKIYDFTTLTKLGKFFKYHSLKIKKNFLSKNRFAMKKIFLRFQKKIYDFTTLSKLGKFFKYSF